MNLHFTGNKSTGNKQIRCASLLVVSRKITRKVGRVVNCGKKKGGRGEALGRRGWGGVILYFLVVVNTFNNLEVIFSP